jgi:predicted lipoprotein with Yx(FWY)xxD motif
MGRPAHLLVVLTIVLVAAGCGEQQETTPAATGNPPTVTVADTSLGEVLVDGDGRTLYLFEPDQQGPSTCVDECAANWPPLLDEEPQAGSGVESDLLATAERDDGTTQVTYDGWPLYHWIADEEPGDVAGQGIDDIWWVVRADGSPVREAEDSAPSY